MRVFLVLVLTAVVVTAVAMYVLGTPGKAGHADEPGAKPQYLFTYYLDA